MMDITAQESGADIFSAHSVWDRRKLRRSLKRRMPLGTDFPETLQDVLDVMVFGENGALSSVSAPSYEVLMLLANEKWGEGARRSEGLMCLFIRFCEEILASEKQGPDAFAEFVALEKARRKTDSKKKKFAYAFTPRENTILKLMKKGMANKEIAETLEISTFTVKDHIKHIMKKMDIHTRSGIVGRLV